MFWLLMKSSLATYRNMFWLLIIAFQDSLSERCKYFLMVVVYNGIYFPKENDWRHLNWTLKRLAHLLQFVVMGRASWFKMIDLFRFMKLQAVSVKRCEFWSGMWLYEIIDTLSCYFLFTHVLISWCFGLLIVWNWSSPFPLQ